MPQNMPRHQPLSAARARNISIQFNLMFLFAKREYWRVENASANF